ncbi:hypothetical protein MMC26_004913 [Xylographa opegraphella]|nr:hypothetical protein [Xylographa opegraphella]
MAVSPPTTASAQQSLNVPADFVQNRLDASYHPAFADHNAHFIMDLGRFGGNDDEKALAELKLWEGADVEKEQLYQAIEKYERKCKPKHQTCRTIAEIRTAQHTWGDILGEADRAAKQHEDKGIVIKYMRKLRDCAPSFEDWTTLLPQGDYSGVVSLGFIMVLKAAARMSEVHSILYEVMGSIPEYISNAERYKSIYKSTRNVKLVKKTALLYSSIVVALVEVFAYLGERSVVSPVKAFLLGQKYQKRLEEKLKAVLAATEAVKSEATICLHEVNAEGLVRTIANEDQRRQDYAEAQAQNRQADQMLYQKLESVDEKINYLSNALDAAYRQLRSSQFLNPLTNMPQSQGYVQGDNISRSTSPMAAAKRAALSPKQILKSLDFRRGDAHNDLIDRLQLGYSMPLSQQGRAVDLIRSDNLKDWLKIMASDVLLVHGGSADEDTEEPLSFVSAKIITTLQDLDPVITIHYFCGLHRDQRSKIGTGGDAQTMMSSLLGQLLIQDKYEFALDFVTSHDLTMLKIDDLKTLCVIVGSLIKQLPPASALFCVLDGIFAFEDSTRSDDLIKALRYLVRLSHKSKDVSFKLLLTCAGDCQFWRQYEITEGQALLMDEELVNDEGHGYNDELFNDDLAPALVEHDNDYDESQDPKIILDEYPEDF